MRQLTAEEQRQLDEVMPLLEDWLVRLQLDLVFEGVEITMPSKVPSKPKKRRRAPRKD